MDVFVTRLAQRDEVIWSVVRGVTVFVVDDDIFGVATDPTRSVVVLETHLAVCGGHSLHPML
jgi:hypothetical protein